MDDLKIECFLTLAETLSFTKASDLLYKSQSVLSRQIAGLEKELDTRLFIRNSKEVSLTPAGRVLASGLRNIRESYTSLLGEMRAVRDGLLGELKIGALRGQLIGDHLVPLLKAFELKFPDIRTLLAAADLNELHQKLISKQLDCVFCYTRDFSGTPNFTYCSVCRPKNCVVIPRGHALAAGSPSEMTLADFKDETIILIDIQDSLGSWNTLRERCAKAGFQPKIVFSPDLGTLMFMLEAGRGIAILNESHVFRDNPRLKFLPLPEMGYTEESIIWNDGNTNPCVRAFTGYVREYGSKLHI